MHEYVYKTAGHKWTSMLLVVSLALILEISASCPGLETILLSCCFIDRLALAARGT